MKKDQKTPRKLTLNRETLRRLEEKQLQEIGGGGTRFAACSVGPCGTTDCWDTVGC